MITNTEKRTIKELQLLYTKPLLDLVFEAQTIHRLHHDPLEIQVSTLVNIKSGGCPENCAYCPQSVHNTAKVPVEKLMDVQKVIELAKSAKTNGASRICLGAAWREVRDNRDFEHVLEMVSSIAEEKMEVCCTLGMITSEQAIKLKKAGLTAYNHNLDTSEAYYDKIITTRDYQDRLNTLKNARNAGIALCSGGIIGMGESIEDRLQMLLTLASLDPAPESVPINLLVPVEGTELDKQELTSVWELTRMIAIARILMPKSNIRLSAGRERINHEGQALCFLAGANSIFMGEKLLTTDNCTFKNDTRLFEILGLKFTS
jgi:biotin synthase